MKKSILTRLLILIFISIGVIVGCSSTQDPTQKKPGFLPDYSLLKPIPSSDETKVYRYVNPNFQRSDYHGVIVESVAIYQPTTESSISPEVIKQVRMDLDNSLKEAAAKQFKVTDHPGPGVARLSVAITGAELQGDGFKPRYLIPISGLIQLTAMATGYDNKKPVLIIEAKIVDSKSGKLLGESVSIISGEKFRDSDKTKEAFKTLITEWIKYTVKNAAGYNNPNPVTN